MRAGVPAPHAITTTVDAIRGREGSNHVPVNAVPSEALNFTGRSSTVLVVLTLIAVIVRCALAFARQIARELRCGYFPAAARILARPQRRKIAAAATLCLGAQRRNGGGGQRKCRRSRAHRPELLHDAVHDSSRGPSGEDV